MSLAYPHEYVELRVRVAHDVGSYFFEHALVAEFADVAERRKDEGDETEKGGAQYMWMPDRHCMI